MPRPKPLCQIVWFLDFPQIKKVLAARVVPNAINTLSIPHKICECNIFIHEISLAAMANFFSETRMIGLQKNVLFLKREMSLGDCKTLESAKGAILCLCFGQIVFENVARARRTAEMNGENYLGDHRFRLRDRHDAHEIDSD